MKRLLQLTLIMLTAFYLVSCSADPKGLVISSSDVDKRFEDSSTMPNKKGVAIPENEFSFIVVADTHVYKGDASDLIALKNKLNSDGENDKFLIACGDISQCGAAEDFQAFKDALEDENFPVYTTIGNHDLYYDGWSNYRRILGKSCYTFNAGEVLFISFDSANGTLGRKQKNWLEWVLNNKTESLVIIFTHFEFFSPGSTTIQQYTDIEEVAYLVHLFGKTGVDYVFMGHSHQFSHNEIGGVHFVNAPGFHGDRKYLRVKVNKSSGSIDYEQNSI